MFKLRVWGGNFEPPILLGKRLGTFRDSARIWISQHWQYRVVQLPIWICRKEEHYLTTSIMHDWIFLPYGPRQDPSDPGKIQKHGRTILKGLLDIFHIWADFSHWKIPLTQRVYNPACCTVYFMNSTISISSSVISTVCPQRRLSTDSKVPQLMVLYGVW